MKLTIKQIERLKDVVVHLGVKESTDLFRKLGVIGQKDYICEFSAKELTKAYKLAEKMYADYHVDIQSFHDYYLYVKVSSVPSAEEVSVQGISDEYDEWNDLFYTDAIQSIIARWTLEEVNEFIEENGVETFTQN